MEKPSSLYVHVPFCEHICGYCDFVKLINCDRFAKEYLPSLIKEIASFGLSFSSLSTIYVGGGTPTCLTLEELSLLLEALSPLLKEDGEFSIEANPETLSLEKALLLRKYGVNRVSMGAESFDEGLLKMMGRKHSPQDVEKAYGILKEAGFENINVDLMYAFPGESKETLNSDLEELLKLNPPHISAYSLILEDDSIFKKEGIEEASQDEQAKQYQIVLECLRKHGYDRYEVSNFSKPGFNCRHNLVYWQDQGYYAAGLGASGYVDDIRYSNTRSLKDYLGKENKRKTEEKVDPSSDLEYFLLTNLRLERGFSEENFQKRFSATFSSLYGEKAKKLEREGLLRLEGGRVFATDEGILLLDRVLIDLY